MQYVTYMLWFLQFIHCFPYTRSFEKPAFCMKFDKCTAHSWVSIKLQREHEYPLDLKRQPEGRTDELWRRPWSLWWHKEWEVTKLTTTGTGKNNNRYIFPVSGERSSRITVIVDYVDLAWVSSTQWWHREVESKCTVSYKEYLPRQVLEKFYTNNNCDYFFWVILNTYFKYVLIKYPY